MMIVPPMCRGRGKASFAAQLSFSIEQAQRVSQNGTGWHSLSSILRTFVCG